jgi:hypothetical protein
MKSESLAGGRHQPLLYGAFPEFGGVYHGAGFGSAVQHRSVPCRLGDGMGRGTLFVTLECHTRVEAEQRLRAAGSYVDRLTGELKSSALAIAQLEDKLQRERQRAFVRSAKACC